MGLARYSLALLAVGLLAAAEPSPFTGEIDVVFTGITVPGLNREPGQLFERTARFTLVADEGVWPDAYGVIHNRATHRAVVRRAAVDRTAGTIALELDVEMGADPWLGGGRCTLAAELAKADDGAWSGTWRQRFRDVDYRGAATARIRQRRPVMVEDFQPFALDEHPRLLFRRTDIPALQEKLATPFGQAWRAWAEKSNDLVALGVLYRLTGERRFADRAAKIVESFDGDIDPGFTGGTGSFGHRCVAVWLAYDLCHDAWDEILRRKLEHFMRSGRLETRLFYVFGGHGGQCNYDPCSNYYGPSMGSIGLVTLALLGARSPAPVEPRNPDAPPVPLPPDAGFARDPGTPVVDLVLDRMPRRWLAQEPLPYRLAWKRCEGFPRVRTFPAKGGDYPYYIPRTTGAPKTLRLPYRELADEDFGATGLKLAPLVERAERLAKRLADEGLDLAIIPRAGPGITAAFYTVLRVDRAIDVAALRDPASARVWLRGVDLVELTDGQLYRLEPGEYPLVVALPTDREDGESTLRFVGTDHPERERQRTAYRKRLGTWRAATAWWRDHGGADPEVLRQARRAEYRVLRHLRRGIDDGGYAAETGAYADIASFYPLLYADCYRRMYGRDVSPFPDATHLLTRKVMQQVYPAGKKPFADSISCSAYFDPARRDWFGAGWELTPDQWKPGVLWAWNRVLRLDDRGEVPEIFTDNRLGALPKTLTFLRYPLDLEPVHPGESLPQTWHADGLGFHLFRAGWDTDAGMVQVLTRTRRIGGHNNPAAGAFTLYGLGRYWNTGARHKYATRIEESVVQLGDAGIDAGGLAREIDRWEEADGSGGVAIDLAGVYRKGERKQRTDAGVRGTRAIAVDFSGKGGAPIVFAIADRISGGGAKTWQWVLREGDRERVELLADGFRITVGEASLRATVVAPAQPTIALAAEPDRVTVTGGDEFLVVATVQRGEAPAVTAVTEEGALVAEVGGRRVRFAGTELRFSAAGEAAGAP